MRLRNNAPIPKRTARALRPIAGAILGLVPLLALSTPRPVEAAPWVAAYLPAWEVSQNGVSPSGVDMKSITHLIWFSLAPTSSGTVVETSGDPGINANAAAVATAAHNAGKKVLISIGGAGTEGAFQAAFNAGKTSTLVSSITSWVSSHGYDGVDIDDEPLAPGDTAQYQAFIRALRTGLGTKVLTCAAEPYGSNTAAVAGVASSFDQVNIMTYDMIYGNGLADGSGELTWHNAPISNGSNFEQTGPAMPSIAGAVSRFTGAGVATSKLGIGAAFYGYVFPGTTGPMQAYRGAWPPAALSYTQIVNTYFNSTYYHYDSAVGAAWIGRTDTANFVTYDDPTAVAAKVNYLAPHGLGGLVCFEIGQQYNGGANPLLKAIDTALGGSTGSTTGGTTGTTGGITPGIHTLTPQNATGSRLDDNGAGTTNNTKIQIWTSNGSAAQQWNMTTSGVTPAGNWNLAVNLGPYCLDANGGASGTATHLWSCLGISNQSWKATKNSNGTYTFTSAVSGNCLDVAGAGTANGTVVQSATCNTSTAQQWAVN